jgi:hypothetical protein
LWANSRDLIGIFIQITGPSLSVWANPVQFSLNGQSTPPGRRACRRSTQRRRPTLSSRSQGRLEYISCLQTYLPEGIIPSRAAESALTQQALLGHHPPLGHPCCGRHRLCDVPGLQLESGVEGLEPPRVSEVRPLSVSMGPASLPPPCLRFSDHVAGAGLISCLL